MATRASLSFLSLLLLATLASASVEELCKKAAATDDKIKPDFCIKSLTAVPGSTTADDRGLGAIAGNLASQKAKTTLPKIAQLLQNAGSPQKDPLEDCRELYGEAVDDLKTAADDTSQGKYSDANTHFSKGMDVAAREEVAVTVGGGRQRAAPARRHRGIRHQRRPLNILENLVNGTVAGKNQQGSSARAELGGPRGIGRVALSSKRRSRPAKNH
ncbi:hypothetical protein Taro_009346 [Colocasia esculenta]|uniref:Pectinesterase inhibitor domain-containing protein n=1 Tax=Colocasia esculenta TaxID=4460 RepID=A0A843U0L5_COLES|nr:hypothetical protein [Colocasia esculenta]